MDRGLSTADQPQQVVFAPVYSLPFGRGHIGGNNAIVSALTESSTAASCSNLPGQGTCMPAYAPGFSGSARQNGSWGHGATSQTLPTISYLNSNAFLSTTQLADYAYMIGNAARTAPDNLWAPSTYNIDASIRRSFNIYKERVKFIFEADAFNVTNKVLFGSGTTNAAASIGQQVGSSTFGVASGQANNTRAWQFSGCINF